MFELNDKNLRINCGKLQFTSQDQLAQFFLSSQLKGLIKIIIDELERLPNNLIRTIGEQNPNLCVLMLREFGLACITDDVIYEQLNNFCPDALVCITYQE